MRLRPILHGAAAAGILTVLTLQHRAGLTVDMLTVQHQAASSPGVEIGTSDDGAGYIHIFDQHGLKVWEAPAFYRTPWQIRAEARAIEQAADEAELEAATLNPSRSNPTILEQRRILETRANRLRSEARRLRAEADQLEPKTP